jgi:hypothetical protein
MHPVISNEDHSLPASSPPYPRLEVRPKLVRNVVFFVAGWVAMVGTSLFLVLYDKGGLVVKALGMIGLLFFVPAGFYGLMVVIPGWFRRPASLILTTAGLERYTRNGAAFIPWNDVAKIGLLKMSGNDLLGLRLSSYDYYLNNLSPLVAHDLNRSTAFNKKLYRLIGKGSSWDSHEARSLWSRLAGIDDLGGTLKELGDIGALAEILLISRQAWGYDLLFAWYDLDRPAEEMAGLMEAYRQNRPL